MPFVAFAVCSCADYKYRGTDRRRWECLFRYGEPGSGVFPQISKGPVTQSLAPMAVTAEHCSGGGGPSVTIRLLLACALLLVASGIEPNPGPATPRVVLPTPCDEPLVTPQRRPTTKSTSNDAEATPPVTCCMQCKRTTPDQSTISCSLCHESIHLGCFKAGNYLEGQGWRKQEPPNTSVNYSTLRPSNSSATRAFRNLPPSYNTTPLSPLPSALSKTNLIS